MNASILWADDEIDLLRPHVMFLQEKGYTVDTVNNGLDAVEKAGGKEYDIVFLDENMPGLSGLETLTRLKGLRPQTPVVMITKSEEEHIMEEAIGSKISDYLIKPVNPNQILLALKKHLDGRRLVSEKVTSDYQQQFRRLGMRLGDRLGVQDWKDLYQELVRWELELSRNADPGMAGILRSQWREANDLFSRFVADRYADWVGGRDDDAPLQSHQLFKARVAPHIDEQRGPLFMVLIDNLRLDQWRVLEPIINEHFRVEEQDLFFSILPTATQYARNALFAGMMPGEIEKRFPGKWISEDAEGSKNAHEEEFLAAQLQRLGKNVKHSYHKITSLAQGRKLADSLDNLMGNALNVVVYNFVDMLSHARTEMEVIRELAEDDAAYRSLTRSWFEHSPLRDILTGIAARKGRLVITTDHGTIRVESPSKVVGDRNTNSNLRYKHGRNLTYEERDVLVVKDPTKVFLPRANVSTTYIFARHDAFFVYPNNYNHFVNYYRHTFQHGGISMEEMMVPVVLLSPR
ncbi:MAG: PglZ domain-containing protein [Flavobacteriales bacterium]|nr:Chemotaxis response regulator protein-glutamate methylesterase [Flavobacteriales bacterium]MCC6577653.1 PglZ domain-containing protein [Flavobacteriales bacterium]NUQ16485.1 PglZ domain-containing protein [Flavobacteriales bacterium]